MYITVQTMDGRTRHRVSHLSRLTSVKDVKETCVGLFGASLDRLRLFHKGKHLEDSHLIFEYGVRRADVVQLVIKPVQDIVSSIKSVHSTAIAGPLNDKCEDIGSGNSADAPDDEEIDADAFATVYKIGDIVDVRQRGAWYEAIVVKVTKKIKNKSCSTRSHEEGSGTNVNGDCLNVNHEIGILTSVATENSLRSAEAGESTASGEACQADEAASSTVTTSTNVNVACNGGDAISQTVNANGEPKNESREAADGAGALSVEAESPAVAVVSNENGKSTDSVMTVEMDNSTTATCSEPLQVSDVIKGQQGDLTVAAPPCQFNDTGSTDQSAEVSSAENLREVGSAALHKRVDDTGMPHSAPNGDTPEETALAKDPADVSNSTRAGNGPEMSNTVAAPLKECQDSDDIVYYVRYDSDDPEESPDAVPAKHVRPRARTRLSAASLVPGQTVMVNYNIDTPATRGRWYDCTVQQVTRIEKRCRSKVEVICTVYLSDELTPLHDCVLAVTDEVYKIEDPGTQLNINTHGKRGVPASRRCEYECEKCKDDDGKNCRHCACSVCGGKDHPDLQVICDECNAAFHTTCLDPPLPAIPAEEEWYCPRCKNDADIVKAGEKLKESKKKAKMPSANPRNPDRDWDKGMACSGRIKDCTLVPPNHFGTIPGVAVGSMWKYRLQVSEAGVHRPHVAGIHGREDEGAFSICLAGGYEDDVDHGDWFLFTGSGGRDLSGNKRTAAQSCDQELTRMNKALAKNITDQPLDAKRGATARNWKVGKPVRVVRSAGLRKRSKYAPLEGNRYDGLYKVVRYWPEKGRSGYLVWRYELRRDDPTPAPWTKQGMALCKKLNLKMEYPEGYHDKAEQTPDVGETKSQKRKRDDHQADDVTSDAKRSRQGGPAYKLSPQVAKLIKQDMVNKKLWDEAIQAASEGEHRFLVKVQEAFQCMCCQDVVCKPITTGCAHNVCKSCLTRSFRAQVFTCPQCRFELGKDYKMVVNNVLAEVLSELFPGYENGR